MSWDELLADMRRDYSQQRAPLSEHATVVMLHSGVETDRAAAARISDEWYDSWLEKATDELWYLQDAAARDRVTVRGLEQVLAAVDAGCSVLLVGSHFGAHTLNWVHLDRLGLPLTILVHESMLGVVDNYGLRNATWMTPSQHGFLRAIRSARGSIFVTYADIGADGGPLPIVGGTFTAGSPAAGIMRATGIPAFFTSFEALDDGMGRRFEIVITSIRDDFQAAVTDWLDDALDRRPHQWMLWRRLQVSGDVPQQEFGWHGDGKDDS